MLGSPVIIVLAAYLGLASAIYSATPFSDGGCQNSIGNYSYRAGNGTVTNTPFDMGGGVRQANPAGGYGFQTYTEITFDIPTASGSVGQAIYWKIPDLDNPTCRVLFINPFQAAGQKSVPGNVVLYAGSNQTCYPASFASNTMHMSFCCGKDDCAAFDVGLDVLDPQNAEDTQAAGQDAKAGQATTGGPSKSVAHALAQKAQVKAPVNSTTQIKRRYTTTHGSISARALAEAHPDLRSRSLVSRDAGPDCGSNVDCYNNHWGQCTSTLVDGRKTSKPGKQVAFGSFQQCDVHSTAPCQIAHANTNSYSFELTVGASQSSTSGTSSSTSSSSESISSADVTTKDGYSLSVGAGIGIGPFSMSTSMTDDHETTKDNSQENVSASQQASSESMSNTIAKQTNTGTTNSSSDTTTQTLNIIPGGYATMTFTPNFDCYQIDITCADPKDPDPKDNLWTWKDALGGTVSSPKLRTEICTPTLSDNVVQGSYDLLYADASSPQ